MITQSVSVIKKTKRVREKTRLSVNQQDCIHVIVLKLCEK